ncbi:MAG: hypothetical protein RLZZ450_2748 [Pseudomonadota bacterium]
MLSPFSSKLATAVNSLDAPISELSTRPEEAG